MRFLVLIFALLAGTAHADRVCDELWFTRNLVFDRAGYCFGSPLGQQLFDNGDCTTSQPELHPMDAALVAEIKQSEAEWECDLDTSRTDHDFPDLSTWSMMQDLPVNGGYESACIGWQTAPRAVRNGHHGQAGRLGEVREGDGLFFQMLAKDGYEYVTVLRHDQPVLEGWVAWPKHDPEICAGWAG